MRRWAAVAVLPLVLAACGDGDDVGEKPDLPDETPALWNPCDVLDERFVERHFGSDTTEQAGTARRPECRFVPAQEGDPAVTVNYQLFSGTLDEVFATMDISPDAEVSAPDIAGADDARIIVNTNKQDAGVTGFVDNGGLVQNVNVVDPAPYDARRLLAGVRAVLTALSEHAVDSGVEGTD